LKNEKDMKFGTKAIHAGLEYDSATGAIMTPIYQTSTYVQDGIGNHKGYEYSRTLNPTRHALEKNLAAIENGKHGACFGSGLAAMDCLIKVLNPGDEVISTNDLYGGSYRIFTTIFEKYGIKFHFVSMNDTSEVEAKINENTKMIWVETPTNPMMNIIDIKAVSKIAKANNCLLAVDNTFATPYLQNPLDLGADVVMHSVTKYLGGHSDVVMGALICNDDDLAKEIYRIQNSSGAVCGPQDSFLVLRGIKTLHLRVQRHCENGKVIANFLKNHPKVDDVFWPGFENHPNHDIAKNQMRDFGGMVSFTLVGNKLEDALDVVKKVKIFALAESLGGVESLIGHPATMTHAAIPKEEREKTGVVDTLIRLSVGVEDVEDLIADLEQAFN
jgi:cystathionine beta-lyase/cystathionine gamma-synthase